MGQHALVEYALRLKDSGMEAERIVERLGKDQRIHGSLPECLMIRYVLLQRRIAEPGISQEKRLLKINSPGLTNLLCQQIVCAAAEGQRYGS